jgi:hypothetical protein
MENELTKKAVQLGISEKQIEFIYNQKTGWEVKEKYQTEKSKVLKLFCQIYKSKLNEKKEV